MSNWSGYTVQRTDGISICWDCQFNNGIWCNMKRRATSAISCDSYEQIQYAAATSSAGPIREGK